MTSQRFTTPAADGRDKYLELVRQFPLRRIRTEEDLDRAVAMTHTLLDRDLDAWEEDYLEVLGDLIERYETAAHPLDAVSDAEMLKHLFEARGVTQAQASADTGIAESTLSAVVRGKRKLTRRHVGTLARYFHVSPAVFLPSSADAPSP